MLPEIIHHKPEHMGTTFPTVIVGEVFSIEGRGGLFLKVSSDQALVLEIPRSSTLRSYQLINLSDVPYQGLSFIIKKVTIEVHS